MANNQTTSSNKTNMIVCYAPYMIGTNGYWQGDDPLDYSLPLFISQLTLIVVVTRFFVFILKPLHQPRVNAEILGGLVLGPTVLGRNSKISARLFPARSIVVLETTANVGLLYFLFMVGVEMDVEAIKRTGRKSFAIAIAGMILPFLLGAGYALFMHPDLANGSFIIFLGVSLSVTAFPVLARILAELKLFNTELGRLALSAALVNDLLAWILLAIAIAMADTGKSYLASFWVILTSVAFVCFCIFVVRPIIRRVIRQTPEGETFSEFYVCLILTGVMVAGFIMDAIGTHPVFGAFVYGFVIPNDGPLGVTLIEKVEDFVTGLLLPLFFAINGLKTDLAALNDPRKWLILLILISLACAGKVVGTLLMTIGYHMPVHEGTALGFLMNAKGLIEMILLNVGRDQNVFDERTFSSMVVTAVIMTGIIMPIVTTIHMPAKRFVPYRSRAIERSKQDTELRVMVCLHSSRNVTAIINLLEISNPSKRSPIRVYLVHLAELTGRASALLIVHNTRKSGAFNSNQANSDHIFGAFESYVQRTGCVTVQPLTAFSPYSTMHEDICNLAEDKCVSIIIIPFHKQQTVDGRMEAANPAFRMINQSVLANAPCTVGILVDKCLTASTRLYASNASHQIAVLFFGGGDDREALSYAWRMSEHPETSLLLMRFVPGHEVVETAQKSDGDPDQSMILSVSALDEELINKFKLKTAGDRSISYVEKDVNNGEETVAAISEMENIYDLFIVGRGQAMVSPMTAGLTDWSECPELGVIGDWLASSDFKANASVLVVQQYDGFEALEEELGTPDGSISITNDYCIHR